MTESSMPKSAHDWAQFLNRKILPSPFRVGELVLKTLTKETPSYAQLAKIINRDPILSLSVMTKAKLLALEVSDANRAECKSVAHALSLIGLEGLHETISTLPKKPISPKNITSFYYLRSLSNSLYAAHLAQAISERKHKGNAEDIYWSALFFAAPNWYMWRYATPEMRLVRYAIRSNYKLPEIAQTEVLGDTLNKITQTTAKSLALPEMAQECYLKANQLSFKEWVKIAHCVDESGIIGTVDDLGLKLKMQKPHFIVMLANLVAHYASYCWYSRATLRAQRILAVYLNCSLSEAVSFTHQVAANMSRKHALPGLMSPAAKLIIPPRKRIKVKQQKSLDAFQQSQFDTRVLPAGVTGIALPENVIPKAKPEEHPSGHHATPADAAQERETDQLDKPLEKDQTSGDKNTTAPSPSTLTQEDTFIDANNSDKPTASNLEDRRILPSETRISKAPPEEPRTSPLLEELTEILLKHPDEFHDFHELMNAATQGIAYGIGLKRAFVALVNKDISRLKTYYTVGCRESEAIKNFDTTIFSDTIFRKLCERPASIWIKPNSERKIQQLIPVNFKRTINSDEFFLMSVFVGKKPVAIFYGDHDLQSLSEHQYKQFKQFCTAVSSALVYQAKLIKK